MREKVAKLIYLCPKMALGLFQRKDVIFVMYKSNQISHEHKDHP